MCWPPSVTQALHFMHWPKCLFFHFFFSSVFKEDLLRWEWEPGSGFCHERAPHSGPAAEAGWAPRERHSGWRQGGSAQPCKEQPGITSSRPDLWRCTLGKKTPLSQLQEPLKPHTCGPKPGDNNTWVSWYGWYEMDDAVMKTWEQKTNDG